MFNNIGFIGTGNMASAIAKCIDTTNLTVYLSNRSKEKAINLSKEIVNSKVTDNQTIAAECDLIFLGVKPQQMKEVLEDISNALQSNTDTILVTMAASLTAESIQKMSNTQFPVIRIMPNTPVSVGNGIVLCCGKDVCPITMGHFMNLIKNAGLVTTIDESKIDAASAVAGCGPAFAYMFIEALADGAVACGIARKDAINFAAKMVEGSAEMVLNSGKHPEVLKDEVCSPGGTTIQGVRTLEANKFRSAIIEAVIASYEKNKNLK